MIFGFYNILHPKHICGRYNCLQLKYRSIVPIDLIRWEKIPIECPIGISIDIQCEHNQTHFGKIF